MSKKRPSKPGIRKASVAGKTIGSRSSGSRGACAVEPGDREREDRSAAEPVASESVAALDGATSGTRLTPGWAEQLGKELARADVEKTGKSNKQTIFVRSPEARMKMKLAQRARRAREHQGAR